MNILASLSDYSPLLHPIPSTLHQLSFSFLFSSSHHLLLLLLLFLITGLTPRMLFPFFLSSSKLSAVALNLQSLGKTTFYNLDIFTYNPHSFFHQNLNLTLKDTTRFIFALHGYPQAPEQVQNCLSLPTHKLQL